MIGLLDPRKIKTTNSDLWTHAGWSYCLDYSWIIEHSVDHAKDISLILDVGCGVQPCSPLGSRLAELCGAECIGVDRNFGPDFLDFVPPRPPDLIVWASSLEHNTSSTMKMLYLRSMDMLAPGGLFLATITVSGKSHWFEPSANQCLGPQDAVELFNEKEMHGDYTDVHLAYRNHEFMMSKYLARYGHFNEQDPDFVIAGVMKCKEVE
jgi:hypothetical protein